MIVQITRMVAVHLWKFIAFFLTASLAAKSMLSDYQNRKVLERSGEPPVIIRGASSRAFVSRAVWDRRAALRQRRRL